MKRIETPPPPPPALKGPSTPPPAPQPKPAAVPKKPVKKNRKQERKNKRAAEKLEKARVRAVSVREVPPPVPQPKGRPLLPRKKRIGGAGAAPPPGGSRKDSACTSTTEDDIYEQLEELPLEENSFRLVWQDGRVYLDYRLGSTPGEQLELGAELLTQYKIPENIMFDSVSAPLIDSDSCAVMEKAAILENPCMHEFRGFIKSLGLEL